MAAPPTILRQPPNDRARPGALPGVGRTGATVAQAAEEYLRYIEHDRARKPSTVQGYRWVIKAWILPALGELRVDEVRSAHVEAWIAALERKPSTRRKALVLMHGIFQRATRVYGLPINPVSDVEKPPQMRSGDIEVFSPEEVWALARAAASERDRAIFLTAALTGLRMGELLALHWRDVDFAGSLLRVRASYAGGALTTPKSGKVRLCLMPDRICTSLRGAVPGSSTMERRSLRRLHDPTTATTIHGQDASASIARMRLSQDDGCGLS